MSLKRMNDDLFEAFFKKILFMKATNLRARDSGELITRYNITTQVQQVLTRLVLSIFLEIFVAITGGAIFIYYKQAIISCYYRDSFRVYRCKYNFY